MFILTSSKCPLFLKEVKLEVQSINECVASILHLKELEYGETLNTCLDIFALLVRLALHYGFDYLC